MRNTAEDEITRLVNDQIESWNRGEAEGYASTSGDDLGFTNIRGQRWVGRSEFVRVHERILSGIYAGSRLEAHVERIMFAGTTVAIVEMLLQLTGATSMPAGIGASADGILRTRLLEVFERQSDGKWILLACHNTAVVPGIAP